MTGTPACIRSGDTGLCGVRSQPTNTTIYLYYLGNGPETFNTTTNLYKASQNIVNSAEAFSGGTTWMGSDN